MGLIVPLKRGVYVLAESERKKPLDLLSVANALYEPSYLSLEFALNFYGLIPEYVPVLTSITTRKTARFKNALGIFHYRHINPSCFRGFIHVQHDNQSYFLAEAEKAIVDFLYLNLHRIKSPARGILEDGFRFQNIKNLNPTRLRELSALFNNKKLMGIIDDFCNWLKEERSFYYLKAGVFFC